MRHLIDRLPPAYQPYARLMRLHQPIGTWLLLWPCWWSIALASEGMFPNWFLILWFAIGAVVMRSAGCVINDLWDKGIDAKVERTKQRPLASGELTSKQALRLIAGLFMIGLFILLSLNLLTISLGLLIVIPVIIYPLMKRLTFWPQAFLGLVFNWGAIMGWTAVTNQINVAPVLLYIACNFWTLGYDTIYAHQDKEDDALIGVKSTALLFGDGTRKWMKLFYYSMFMLLIVSGVLAGLGDGFFIGMVFVGLHLFWQVRTLDIHNPENCKNRFRSNAIFGWLVLAAIIAGKVEILNVFYR